MKVAIVSTSTWPAPPRFYGGEVEIWLLARTLGEMGHEVHLFAPGGSEVPHGGQLHYVRGSYGEVSHYAEFDAWDMYREVIEGCDVVHDWSHSGAICEELWLERPQLPLLHTYNGVSFAMPRSGRRNAVVASEEVRRRALAGHGAWYGVDTVQSTEYPGQLLEARVVPWGVDTRWYTPDPTDLLTVGDAQLEPGYLLYVGRPHFAKGTHLILEVAQRLPEERFVLAWRTANQDHRDWEQRFLVVAEKLPNVQCLLLPEVGHHEAKRTLYRGARAFLSPAVYCEAFGMTGVEAMACGAPAILGANGAGPEILGDPDAGIVVNAHLDQESAIRDLETAIEEIPRLSREAARCTAEFFDIRHVTEQYLSLYEAVIAGETW